jgi:hypothetical protein
MSERPLLPSWRPNSRNRALRICVRGNLVHQTNSRANFAFTAYTEGDALHRSTVYARATVNLRGGRMSYAYKLNEDVHHQPQGPQGRAETDPPMIYTIVQRMPIEADGRLRYRIKSKSGNIERVVTEDQLSYSH